jgi:Tfp pilus assembly protein PilO
MLQEKPLWGAGLYVILTLILVIMLVFALRPTLLTISGLLGQTKSLNEISQQLNQKINDVQRASDKLYELEEKMSLLDEALPDNPRWSEWGMKMDTIASEAGVKIEDLGLRSIKLTESTTSAIVGEEARVMFEARMIGGYEQLREYVARMTKTRRLPVVTEVQMVWQREGVLELNLKGYISYLPE